ncbi:alkene reductase [Bradyrhizobium cenepequi]|uniref:alkene reductase n=1 Tax=Bradyrhizobium cenepequi TaxID=2821403 RepID=UPI001CE363A8|nr:alkene reductase [Bradyrhizobium cenepequi]MCA6111188.1 alkene reductase [Bradyrhizobium cenepequi]
MTDEQRPIEPFSSRLFESAMLGGLALPNRIIMAPMSRHRANLDGTPTGRMADYYRQRASAGLIVTEGTFPSWMGRGYLFTPGLCAQGHVVGWRRVTEAVHDAGGRIFCQLMHCGRLSDPLLLPDNADPVAPSAVKPDPSGIYAICPRVALPYPRPRVLSTQEVYAVIAEYASSAALALEAEFDGIEIHGGNGYLPMQFFATNVNQRNDAFGGSVANRCRFMLELVDAVSAICGPDRVGVRIHPGQSFADVSDDDPQATYSYLTPRLSERGIAYLHLSQRDVGWDVIRTLRAQFDGPIIGGGALTRQAASLAIESGRFDLAAFGRAFLANPDLVERFRNGWSINRPDPGTYYSQGLQGYIDYPPFFQIGMADQVNPDEALI